jgi:hypothetical protein
VTLSIWVSYEGKTHHPTVSGSWQGLAGQRAGMQPELVVAPRLAGVGGGRAPKSALMGAFGWAIERGDGLGVG